MHFKHPLKDLRAAFCEHGCLLPALRNPGTLCFTEQLIAVFQLFMFQNHFTLRNEKNEET